MSKYRGLPDIDTAADVFETLDEPEQPLHPSGDGPSEDDVPIKANSEAIDSSTLPNRRKAEKVFGRGPRRTDTSVHYDRARLTITLPRSPSSSSDSESPTQSHSRETPAARLRRLKAELAEVEHEMAAGPSTHPMQPAANAGPGKRKSVLPPKPPRDLIGELAGLKARMAEVELRESILEGPVQDVGTWRDRLGRLAGGEIRDESSRTQAIPRATNGVTLPLATDPASSSAGGPKLSELDRRLASLEDLIGLPLDGLDQNASAPLLSTLSRFDHLLGFLTQPRHLDAISRRIKLLLVDLDRAAAASRRPGASATQPSDKISSNLTLSAPDLASMQTLFSLLPRLDPLLPILPPLLARLHSLASLHAEAGDVADGLRCLQAEDKRAEEGIKELEELVKGVQTGLLEGAKGIERNWQGLEGRMHRLEGRISELC